MGCGAVYGAFKGSTCKAGMSGIKTLWIGDYTNGVTVTFDDTKGLITDIKDAAGTPAAINFYEFQLPIDLGDAEENVSADAKLGTSFVDVALNGTVLGLDQVASDEITKIMRGKQLIIAELYNTDENDKPLFILYGEENGLDMSGGGSRSGAEASSLQGYELSWTGKERDFARYINPDNVNKTGAGTSASLLTVA